MIAGKRNHVCPWWLAYTFDNPVRRLIHRPADMFAALVKEGMTVLDVGCGMGYFSIGLAEMVGEEGRVIAVDLQQQMLDILEKRAAQKGMLSRIRTHLCRAEAIGVTTAVDFALIFWMAHETPSPSSLFRQIAKILKTGGTVLLAEPKMHVSEKQFQNILAAAAHAGLALVNKPRITFSRAALFRVGKV